MRILYILSRTGVLSETFIRVEAQAFSDQGHDVAFLDLKAARIVAIAGSTLQAKERANAHKASAWKGLLESIRLDWKNSLKYLYLFTQLPKYRKAIGRFGPDVVISHFAFSASYCSALLSVSFQMPFHLRLHTRSTNIPLEQWKKLIHRFESCSVISERLKTHVQNNWGYQNKVDVVRQSIDMKAIECVADMDLSKLYDLLAVGRMIPKKGFDQLLRILARQAACKELKLGIVGSGPLQQEWIQLAADLDLTEVTFLGEQAHQETLALIAKSRWLVVPSLDQPKDEEGIPTVIPEALLLGTPVISSNCGAVAEVLPPHLCYNQFDDKALEDLLMKYICSSESEPELGPLKEQIRTAYSNSLNTYHLIGN